MALQVSPGVAWIRILEKYTQQKHEQADEYEPIEDRTITVVRSDGEAIIVKHGYGAIDLGDSDVLSVRTGGGRTHYIPWSMLMHPCSV